MSQSGDRFMRHDQPRAVEQYLASTVRGARPERLRLLLIERAAETAGVLAKTWAAKEKLGANEYSLKLLELLNELLSGVAGGKDPAESEVCQKVADLYVFLVQHLIQAESHSDAGSIEEIKTVLEIEAETWRAVCAQSQSPSQLPSQSQSTQSPPLAQSEPTGGLNLEG